MNQRARQRLLELFKEFCLHIGMGTFFCLLIGVVGVGLGWFVDAAEVYGAKRYVVYCLTAAEYLVITGDILTFAYLYVYYSWELLKAIPKLSHNA
jgi:hypothetical protein